MSAEQLPSCHWPTKTLATPSLPEYVATHSPKTDYLAPLRTRHHAVACWGTCPPFRPLDCRLKQQFSQTRALVYFTQFLCKQHVYQAYRKDSPVTDSYLLFLTVDKFRSISSPPLSTSLFKALMRNITVGLVVSSL